MKQSQSETSPLDSCYQTECCVCVWIYNEACAFVSSVWPDDSWEKLSAAPRPVCERWRPHREDGTKTVSERSLCSANLQIVTSVGFKLNFWADMNPKHKKG